jgi:ribonuclease BN (tRNA processing enzyme)
MKIVFFIFLLFAVFSCAFSTEIKVQILGSGGPLVYKRASTSYLIWIDGKSKILVDLGSGSLLRFNEVGGNIEDLDVVLLTHYHTDHSVDLSEFVKSLYFHNIKNKITLIAPDGNEYFPDLYQFTNSLFGKEGAYRYLNFVFKENIKPIQTASKIGKIKKFKFKDFKIYSLGVNHGIVPAVAYKIIIGDKIISFSGDTSAKTDNLINFVKNSDIFIAHMAINQESNIYAKRLHMTPYRIGEIAKEANIKILILSHRMERTIGHENDNLKEIRKNYKGKIIFAEDKSFFILK